ncbi:cytochrome P450 [Terrarubrum flagellatum]|uniref:cytochrome P450 n=1 Tax=Terrirubrum flagellatum TaxID=2895980 RepID=UPI0031456CDE
MSVALPTSNAFVPFAPTPRERRPSLPLRLWLLSRNPIEVWTRAHYEEPILPEISPLGRITFVSEPTAIKRVFVDNAENYPKDPLQMRILRPGLGEGLLTASGDVWKRTRRTLAPLFTPRRTALASGAMRDCAEARVDRWLKRRPGAILDVAREMTGVTFDILSATLFSNAISADYAGFEKAMTRYIESVGRVDPLDIIGAPTWIPRIGRFAARPSLAFFGKAVERLVAERHALLAKGDKAPDDILTALLKASDPETGIGLTDAEVAANIITFIAAGHETTARGLAWTLHLLAQAPDIRARAEKEAAAASDDPAEWLDELPLIRACIEESMRLFPPVPLMSRGAREDDRLGAITIPAKSLIVVAPWIVHRHRKLWKAPDAFMPERFMPGAREEIDRFAYLPFGSGPRICIGARFAMMEAMIVLTTILRRVRLDAAHPVQPKPVLRITLRPEGGLPMAVRPL